MKEPSQYERRTVYIPSLLPPKPAKPLPTLFSLADMIEDAKRCNARMRKVTEARASGYKKPKYPAKVQSVTLPEGITKGQDITPDDILTILRANQGVTVNMIAVATGAKRQHITHRAEKLIAAGLVQFKRKRSQEAKRLWVIE